MCIDELLSSLNYEKCCQSFIGSYAYGNPSYTYEFWITTAWYNTNKEFRLFVSLLGLNLNLATEALEYVCMT